MLDVSQWPQFEQKRYHAARWVFLHRSEECPRAEDCGDGIRRRISWEKWFELKFGLTLDAYQRHIAERDL
jgi:hypothetical protein